MTVALVTLAVLCGLELAGTLVLVRVLLADRRRAEADWSAERAGLLQRIQAPRHAITAHYNEHVPGGSPRAVTPEDDDDFWESREQLAERLAAEETNPMPVNPPAGFGVSERGDG